MKTLKVTAIACAVVLVLVVLLVAVSTPASAQTNRASVSCKREKYDGQSALKSGRLPPEVAIFTVELNCTVSLPPTTSVCPASTVEVKFEKQKAEPYAVMNPSPTAVYKPISAQGGVSQNPEGAVITGFLSTISIVTTRKAPAFITGEYIVKITATPSAQGGATGGCNIGASEPQTETFNLVNDFFPVIEYQPAKYVVKTGQNKDVLFAVDVTNFGNGDTKINADPATWVSKGKLESVVPPSQLTLESKVISDKALFKKPLTISAKTPHSNGYTNSIYTFSMKFTGSALQTGTDAAKDEQTLTLSVQVQGVYVPGFDLTTLIGGIGLALVGLGVVRRQRH